MDFRANNFCWVSAYFTNYVTEKLKAIKTFSCLKCAVEGGQVAQSTEKGVLKEKWKRKKRGRGIRTKNGEAEERSNR